MRKILGLIVCQK